MFDFAWSEILLIGAVALIAIGPKDMPAAIRSVSSMIKKARRMAAEFQTHVDEMVREADLGDVKKAFTDIRNLDIGGALEKHIDPDRSIRNTFAEDPFKPTYPTADASSAAASSADEVSTLEEIAPATKEAIAEPPPPPEPAKPVVPAFIPPGLVPPPAPQAAAPPEAPAFIPPEVVLQRRSKA
ncbi:MAG TPA: Sec-independent protein translocase protein TatB [Rhodopila sp.]